jgi:hypothetical protein
MKSSGESTRLAGLVFISFGLKPVVADRIETQKAAYRLRKLSYRQ